MLTKERSLKVESEWNKRMREYRAGSGLSKERKKLEISRRDDSIEHLRRVQSGGYLGRLEVRFMDFYAKLLKLLGRAQESDAS